MALIGKIAIAMAVDTKKLGTGLKGAAGQLVGFQAKIEQTGGALKSLLAGAAAYKVAEGIGKMVMTASDLNENMSKTEAIFGSGSKTVVAAADEMAAAFGTSKNQFLDAAGRMGGLFKGAGFSADEAAKLSVNFTRLAGDASSFFNLPFDDAFTKIRSGLSGESEPLKDLGILMTEDMVKAQAMAMGLGKAGQELSNQAKIQARAAIISRGLADAQGDLAKTADGVANRTRELSGRVENLAGAMGTALQPVAQSVLGEMSLAVGAIGLAWEDNKAGVVEWATSAVGGVGETAKSMGILQRAIGFVADAWDVMRLGFFGVQSYITGGLAKIVDGLAYLGHAIDYAVEKLSGFKSSIGDYLDTFGQDLHRLSDEQWAGFQKKLAQPWPSEAVNDYFAKAEAKTKALRDGIAKAPAAATAAAPAGPTPKKSELKFASQIAAGSQEAANATLRSRYGAGLAGKGPAEQTAKNTARSAELLSRIANAVGGGPAPAKPVFGNF